MPCFEPANTFVLRAVLCWDMWFVMLVLSCTADAVVGTALAATCFIHVAAHQKRRCTRPRVSFNIVLDVDVSTMLLGRPTATSAVALGLHTFGLVYVPWCAALECAVLLCHGYPDMLFRIGAQECSTLCAAPWHGWRGGTSPVVHCLRMELRQRRDSCWTRLWPCLGLPPVSVHQSRQDGRGVVRRHNSMCGVCSDTPITLAGLRVAAW